MLIYLTSRDKFRLVYKLPVNWCWSVDYAAGGVTQCPTTVGSVELLLSLEQEQQELVCVHKAVAVRRQG